MIDIERLVEKKFILPTNYQLVNGFVDGAKGQFNKKTILDFYKRISESGELPLIHKPSPRNPKNGKLIQEIDKAKSVYDFMNEINNYLLVGHEVYRKFENGIHCLDNESKGIYLLGKKRTPKYSLKLEPHGKLLQINKFDNGFLFSYKVVESEGMNKVLISFEEEDYLKRVSEEIIKIIDEKI